MPRKYGLPRIINFTEAERMTSERRFAAHEQLKLASGASNEPTGNEQSLPQDHAQSAFVESEHSEDMRRDEAVKSNVSEPVIITKVVPEEIIKDKTRECMDHLVALFDSPPQQATPPLTPQVAHPAETALDRILNP